MAHKAKRPQSATSRTLPPDAKSLVEMVKSVHRQLLDRAKHLKREAHDFHARRGFQTLFEQRASAWQRLNELDPNAAEALCIEFQLLYSQPEVV